MNHYQILKEKIYSKLEELIGSRINETKSALASAKASRDSDTKSTAGDKHETGRAMMQIEMENLDVQLNSLQNLQKALFQINIARNYSNAEFGSLVITNHGNYFMSIGMGKVIVDEKSNYAISLASPIGKALTGKAAGEKITFQGRQMEIIAVV